jgi:hypothetical protein
MLWFNLIPAILGFCPEANSFCVSMKIVSQQTCFTVHSALDGYAAIGIGTQEMRGSDMYIGWANTTGGVTISNMRATGRTAPTPVGLTRSIALLEPRPAFSKLSFSFCKANANTNNYIYATESSKPRGNLNSANPTISFHSGGYGAFNVDLAASSGSGGGVSSGNNAGPILRPSGSLTLESIYGIHGLIMFFAWCISPFLGIFIARHMKSRLGHRWYILHVFFMGIVTGLGTIAGFVLVLLFRPPPHFTAIDIVERTHVLAGLIITIVMVIQIILGIMSDKLFDEKRTSIPWWDKMHWWLGRLTFLVAIVNSYLGLLAFEASFGLAFVYKIIFYVVIALGFISLVFGQLKFGQDNHVADDKGSSSHGSF